MRISWYRGLLLLAVWCTQRVQTEPLHRRIAHKRHNPNGLGGPDSHLRHGGNDDSSRTRPVPSDDLPIVTIIEDPDKSKDPKDEDLNYKKLRRLLKNTFDSAFMSIMLPNELLSKRNGTVVYDLRDGRPRGKMPHYIRSFGTLKLKDRPKRRLKVKTRTKKKLQKFLWTYNYCPVQYVWKDLGIRTWPRWIREGRCYQGRSCSLPPGMTCKVHKKMYKVFLRWHCKTTELSKLQCKWIRFKYPIIEECKCAC